MKTSFGISIMVLLLLVSSASTLWAQDDPDLDGDEDGDLADDDDDDLDGDEDGDLVDDDDDDDATDDDDDSIDDDDDLDGDEDGDLIDDGDDPDGDEDLDLDDEGEQEEESDYETTLVPVETCKRECACAGGADASVTIWFLAALGFGAWMLRRRGAWL